MRLEQLEYLAAVSRYGSLRRASDHLHVSQPAVSEAISKLERELGVTLLERHRTGATVSEAGAALLTPIGEVLDSVDRLRALAGDPKAATGPLRIGTVHAGTQSLVLPAVRELRSHHPTLGVDIRAMRQDEIESALLDGSLHLGLVNLLDDDVVPATLQLTPLVTGRPVAVLPAGHPLASRPVVTVDDLRTEPLVAVHPGYVMHRFAHRLFGARQQEQWHFADGADMAKAMVAERIGVALLPDYSVRGDPFERSGAIVARAIAGDTTVVSMVALHRRAARVRPVVTSMLRHLANHADGVAGVS